MVVVEVVLEYGAGIDKVSQSLEHRIHHSTFGFLQRRSRNTSLARSNVPPQLQAGFLSDR